MNRFCRVIAFVSAIAGQAAVEQPDLAKQVTDLRALALAKSKAGDYGSARSLLEQARALCAPPAVAPPGLYANVLGNLADMLEVQSDWNGATALLKEALAADQQALGPADPRTAAIECRLAQVESAMGDFADAEPLLRSAISIQRAAPSVNKSELALALTALAMLDTDLNRFDEAERVGSEAIAIEEGLRPHTVDYGPMLSSLATVYLMQGQTGRALPLLNRSIAAIAETLSPEDVRVAPVLVERSIAEASDRKFTLAEQDLRHAIAILDRASGSTPGNGDWARLRLGVLYMQEHKLDDAEAILVPTVERQRTFFGGSNVRLALDIAELAHLRELQKRFDEAAALYREAIAMSGKPAGDPSAAPARAKEVHRLAQQAGSIFGFRAVN